VNCILSAPPKPVTFLLSLDKSKRFLDNRNYIPHNLNCVIVSWAPLKTALGTMPSVN
jgi:hypothetical protein